jgi:hypothetical protein
MMQQLREYGMKSETLSVAKKHYEDMALAIYEGRVRGPYNPILVTELLRLRINKDKIDHPRQGSKDLADATCGAIYNAIALTPKDLNRTIEVHDYRDVMKVDNLDKNQYDDSVIKAPAPMPPDLEEALNRIRVI